MTSQSAHSIFSPFSPPRPVDQRYRTKDWLSCHGDHYHHHGEIDVTSEPGRGNKMLPSKCPLQKMPTPHHKPACFYSSTMTPNLLGPHSRTLRRQFQRRVAVGGPRARTLARLALLRTLVADMSMRVWTEWISSRKRGTPPNLRIIDPVNRAPDSRTGERRPTASGKQPASSEIPLPSIPGMLMSATRSAYEGEARRVRARPVRRRDFDVDCRRAFAGMRPVNWRHRR